MHCPLTLIPGQNYYVNVKACNGALHCTSAASQSVIADNSPPVAGVVIVGDKGDHAFYLSNKFVNCELIVNLVYIYCYALLMIATIRTFFLECICIRL